MTKKRLKSKEELPEGHLFRLGVFVFTPEAEGYAIDNGYIDHYAFFAPYIERHVRGDFGTDDPYIQNANRQAIDGPTRSGGSILSGYEVPVDAPSHRIMILTTQYRESTWIMVSQLTE